MIDGLEEYPWRFRILSAIQNPKSEIQIGSQEGFALLLVLWIITLLMVMVTDFSSSMKLEALGANNAKEEAQAYQLALAGKNHALALLTDWGIEKGNYIDMEGDLFFILDSDADAGNPPSEEERIQRKTGFPLGQGVYGFHLEDENAKINLNAFKDTDRDILSNLLQESGVKDPQQRDTVIDSLLDWKDEEDEDQDHRLNGAESDYYETLNPPYQAKNGNFDSVEEMLLLKDMSKYPEILYGSPGRNPSSAGGDAVVPPQGYMGIYRYLTVVGAKSGKINVNTASPAVLRAVGLTEDYVNRLLDDRSQKPFNSMPPWLPLPLRKNLNVITPVYFTVEAWGRAKGSPVLRRIRAIVQARKGKEPLILSWNDNSGPR